MTVGPYAVPQSYSYWIGRTATKYDATDFDIGSGPNGEGEIVFYNSNMGPNGVLGGAVPSYGSVPCVTWINSVPYSNWFCGYGSTRPDNGVIWLNDFYLSNPTVLAIDYGLITVMHEVGHLLGMAHAYSGCMSIMVNNMTSTTSNLTSWETSWINNQY